jgi:hypothetical protein
MVEKDEYTRKYLDEKKKYDHLLAKVNSTSTLGSISLQNPTIDPITCDASLQGVPIYAVQPQLSSAGVHSANNFPSHACAASPNTLSAPHGKPLSDNAWRTPSHTSADALTRSHVTPGAEHQEYPNSCSANPDHSRERAPLPNPATRRGISPQLKSSSPGQASKSMMRERFRAARKRLLNDSRKVAGRALDGAAIGITFVGALVFFPLTIGYLYPRRKSKRYQVYHACLGRMGPRQLYPAKHWQPSEMPLFGYELSEGVYYDHRRFQANFRLCMSCRAQGRGKLTIY